MIMSEALKLTSNLLDIPIFSGTSPDTLNTNLRKTLNHYQFNKFKSFGNYQRMLLAVASLSNDHAIEFIDKFNLHLTILNIKNNFVTVGPYIENTLNQLECTTILRRNGLNPRDSLSLMIFRNQFTLISTEKILQNIQTISKVTKNGDSPIQKQVINFNAEFHEPQFEDYEDEFYRQAIIERYSHEQKFMESIQNAKFHSAMEQWHFLHDSVQPLKQTGNTLAMAKISAAVNRTTIRIAAINAGVPPIINDNLSQISAKKIRNSNSLDQIYQEHEELIKKYCDVIRKLKDAKYSVLTVSILYFLDNNFMNEFNIYDLAQELDLNVNYVIQTFKKNTGITPKKYVISKRITLAKTLLVNTNKYIAEISADTGFTDANYFSKIFKSITSMSPTHYRNQNKFPS